MASSLIFKDRNKLSPHYIPKRLPHREDQINILLSIYGGLIKDINNAYPRFVQIIGDTGTGKTCTTIKFGEHLTQQAKKDRINLRHAYINCKVEGTTKFVLFGNLVKKVAPEISTRSLSPEEMMRELIRYLRVNNQYLILSFDEIDYFLQINPKEHLVYDLTRITEIDPGRPSPIIGIIFIARSLKWHDRLDPAEKSTLGMGVINFPRYKGKEIRDILQDRVDEALKPGAIDDETLDLICDITANPPVNGDIRVGLDLLYYSGNLAENLGVGKILPDHVRKVYGGVNPAITTEDVMSLDNDGKMILLSLARCLRTSKAAYVGLREIRNSYNMLCEEYNMKPCEKFEEHLQDLIYRGIVEMKSLSEIGISGASALDLDKFLSNLMEKLKKTDED
ncbi:MAG: AAA family ATPase [Nitrososphaerota archaeon]|nr:AAA family ATPase [Candidatus Bathyarchaeota archaeon]MDW8048082.1 AAA family ATPase [Nitrososphaerota archaeon]